ncbi:hypothetical protein [Microbacterium algeriense]|uniref:Uncharacterized protein n=1 Tax=Microbacterium algeriense TaxID=2615184 RepID=A0ABQ6VCA1_9MICO|nr:hypothetical protein [Microbacterium algeriense]KAB1867346.1 hypothetical protein F6A08_06045 [Microbacterium algeriense]
MGGTLTKVDIGHGRGWLEAEAAKSQARIDRALGHPQQITEGGRSWEQQDEHWQHYLRYGSPIALHPDTPSVHQRGRAKDTDERNVALMNDHGWFQTVYRWVNGRRTLVEPWHFEYDPERDNHRHEVIELVNDNGTWRVAPDEPVPASTPPVRRDIMSIPVLAMTGGPGDTRVFEISGGSKRHIIHRAELNALQAIAGQLDPHGRPGDKALQDHIAVIGNLASIPNRVDAVTVEQVEAILRRAGVGVGATIDIEAIANAVNDEAARRLKS